MRALLTAATLGATLLVAPVIGGSVAQAAPGGCLKYGAAGAIAGHYAGGHAVKGAIAGCALGYVERRRYKKMMREQANKPATRQHLTLRRVGEQIVECAQPRERLADLECAVGARNGRIARHDDAIGEHEVTRHAQHAGASLDPCAERRRR